MNRVTIGECCEVLDNFRKPINAEERSTMVGNIPYYGANGIQGYIDKYILDEDLILIAEDGGNFEDYQNRPIAYKITGKSWVNNHAHILRARDGFDQDFIYYSIVNKNILHYIKGGTRSKLNKSELVEIPILVPVLPIQHKIAHILSTVDRQIEKTEQLIRKYEMVKEGMMQDLFTRGIDVKTGKLRPTYDEAMGMYKQSELGWIPKEWTISTLQSFCHITSSKRVYYTDYKDSGIPFYRSKEIIEKSNGYNIESELYISNEQYNRLKIQFGVPVAGDILITSVGTLGITYLVTEDDEFYFKDGNLIWLREIHKVVPKYLLRAFNYFIRCQLDNLTIGTSQKAFTIEKLKLMHIATPVDSEMEIINSKYDAIEKVLLNETASLKEFISLKMGIMQDLLTGKNPVSE